MNSPTAVLRAQARTWAGTAAILLTGAGAAAAQTEAHLQYGSLTNPFLKKSNATWILTLQHASMWRYGDNFLFVDFLDDGGDDGFNEKDAYSEWYSNLSLGRILGRDVGFGPVRDLGVFAGVAVGTDSNFRQWLPGARVSWTVPGFVFLNTALMYGIDGGGGVEGGSPPELDGRPILDVSGLLPFGLGGLSFSITGHAEYAAATTDEFGNDVPAWILAQPQLRWDVGRAVGGAANSLHAGVEYQYWANKLGTDVDESVFQLLVVWGFQ